MSFTPSDVITNSAESCFRSGANNTLIFLIVCDVLAGVFPLSVLFVRWICSLVVTNFPHPKPRQGMHWSSGEFDVLLLIAAVTCKIIDILKKVERIEVRSYSRIDLKAISVKQKTNVLVLIDLNFHENCELPDWHIRQHTDVSQTASTGIDTDFSSVQLFWYNYRQYER